MGRFRRPRRGGSVLPHPIAALGGLSAAELKDRWRDLNGTEPPRYNRDFLLKRLAHRIQELAHGGLVEATRARMPESLQDAGLNRLPLHLVRQLNPAVVRSDIAFRG